MFLGIWFDERVTWAVHIQNIVNKFKKIINTMRCLVGSEWGQIKGHVYWLG